MPNDACGRDDDAAFLRLRHGEIDVAVHRLQITAGDKAALQSADDGQRAAAGGHIEVSFVLRRTTEPLEIYSKKTTAIVRGSIVRLEAPEVEGYPSDYIGDDPEHVIVDIPYYAWRRPTDKISLILRYVKSLNEVIVHIETRVVGPSWPAGAPVKRLIYREQLQRFKGYRPELYYVISGTNFTRARAVDLNESLRRVLTIS